MTRNEFDAQLARLTKEYGTAPYGLERINAIWKRFEKVPPHLFQATVSRAFESERVPPLAKELGRILEEIRVEEHNRTKPKREQNSYSGPLPDENFVRAIGQETLQRIARATPGKITRENQ